MVNAPSIQPKPGRFDVPAPAVASHPDVILNPRDLRRWIETLPLANPAKACGLLLHQLRLLARDPQRNTRFLSLLGLYHEPAELLHSIVNERLPTGLDCALPLDQLEALLVEFLDEFASGYLRLANEAIAAGKAPELETLFPAMRLLDAAIGIERLHYRRPSLRHWRQLLQIYRHAEYQQIAKQGVDARLRPQDGPDNIHALFFRALILSLCDPNNQAPGEVLAWHDWIGDHAGLLGLTVLPQGAFAVPIDISGEQPPLTSARKSRPGPNTHYLSGDRFLQQLERDATAPAGLHRALMGLIKGRRKPEQRKAERRPRNHPYRLIHGMRDIHRRLTALTQGPLPDRNEITATNCLQVNQSKFGAAFVLQGPVIPPMSIGEPILAEAEGGAATATPVGFTARIRRVFSEDDRRIEIGVEKIQGRLVPLTLVGSAANRSRGNDLALLQHDTDSGRYTLIATRNIFREGDHVAADGPNIRHNLRMLRLGGVVQHTAYIDVEPVDI